MKEADFIVWSMSGSVLQGPFCAILVHLPFCVMKCYQPHSMAEAKDL